MKIIACLVILASLSSVVGCYDRVVVRRPRSEVVVVHPVRPVVRGEVIVR
jgi:hypothetical protein